MVVIWRLRPPFDKPHPCEPENYRAAIRTALANPSPNSQPWLIPDMSELEEQDWR